MNKNKSIPEAIKFILGSLEAQGQAPGTLKNYQSSFNIFEKYLNEHGISRVDEDVCLEYIYFKTGQKLCSFNEKVLNSNIKQADETAASAFNVSEHGRISIPTKKDKGAVLVSGSIPG